MTRLYPQADTTNTSDALRSPLNLVHQISQETLLTYSSAVTFDVASDHKIDSRAAGRYLSYKMTLASDDYKDFSFSGFDIDITQTGAR